MSLPFNIAIDGYSSSGKSTIAKLIALKYRMQYIDTGAMYRAITLFCIRNKIIIDRKVNTHHLKKILNDIDVKFSFDLKKNKSITFLNNQDVEKHIRGPEVSNKVSIIAKIEEVRKKLVLLQKEIGKKGNVVMDGRDIGSKVFPDAKIKLFIIADIKIRARRRSDEMKKRGYKIPFDEILLNIEKRDYQDMNRKLNPLIKPQDAIVVDNSVLLIQDQIDFIDTLVQDKLHSI